MNTNTFQLRHIGPNKSEREKMLQTINADSLEQLISETVPENIRLKEDLDLAPAMSEYEYLSHIKELSEKNKVFKSYIGLGYHEAIVPSVIQRNILENPGWYTAYTPYQAEIAQGRLEALLNFQTMVCDLTGMELANASLLDESTAAAEAMALLFDVRERAQKKAVANKFFVSEEILPQTLSVLLTDTINGCDSTLYIDVSVNPQPVPSIAGADSICQSIESAFIAPANANYTYQWTASTGLFTGVATDDTATISFAQGGSHTISLRITNAVTGCDSSITKTIFVDSLPISVISGNNPVCEGSIGNVYQAVSNSLYSYTWVPTLGTITAGAGTNAVTIDWPTAGSGNLQLSIVKAPLGCINKIQYPVTITAKPVTGAVQYR